MKIWYTEKSMNYEVRAIWTEISASPPTSYVILGMLPNLCKSGYSHGDKTTNFIGFVLLFFFN